MDIGKKIKGLPDTPGVYIMKDAAGGVLYVGKAINLKKRVSSYFRKPGALQDRIRVMVGKVADISYLPAATEAEALIYENSLIKQLSPRYNVALRDDKSYPRLKLTMNEEFPRIFITRKKLEDGAVYYGPFTGAALLKEALVMLRRIFPLRTCDRMPKSVCLNYHIHQCPGPCEERIDRERYMDTVSELKLFLDGDRAGLMKHLTTRMAKAAGRENFEEAARLKARIDALGSMRESSVSYRPGEELEELGAMLGIKGRLETIEAFDISNIMGQEAVGSMVSFYKGRPRKGGYRKFRINNVDGVDDYSMMREIVYRRYARIMEEKCALPDLILIDGGKGHLAAALSELAKLGIADVPAIGLAKEFEHVYLKDRREPLILPKDSKALHLLERIRDEAHRFAITYHKGLRSKKVERSELDEVPGIGPKKKRILIRRFGSVDNIRNASAGEVAAVKGINAKDAENIVSHFRERQSH